MLFVTHGIAESVFGGMLFSSFTIGTNDSVPEVLAILLTDSEFSRLVFSQFGL